MKQKSALCLLFSFLTLSCLGIAIWWISATVVWLGDDLDYKYIMKGEIWQSWGHINTWSDFWQSQFTHYRHVNGRFVAHTLVQLFNGILGQPVFAVANAIVYVLFAFFLAKAGKVDIYNSGGIFSAVCLSVVCFVTKMMPTCQIGYIWGMTVNLIWLAAFFKGSRPSWHKVAVMAAFGLIAGNWQESVSIGICAGLGIWWLGQFFRHDKTFRDFFDWRRSYMMLGYFTGTAANCFSPANISRVESVITPLSEQLMVASYSLSGVVLLIIVMAVLAARHSFNISYSLKSYDSYIPEGVLAVAILFLLIFNFVIGVYSNRQLFGANMFAIVLLLMILPRHNLGGWTNLAAFIAALTIWALNLAGIEEVRSQYDSISALYAKSKDGVVEFDRTRVMTIGHPLAAKYYEDILGQFDNDLHHSLMKDFKHNKKGKALKLRPSTTPDSEKVEEYAPGHFYVTVKEPTEGNTTKEITVYGHYSLFGIINIEARPHKLRLLKYSRRSKPYATAVVIPEYPLFKADSISL